jgi:transposase
MDMNAGYELEVKRHCPQAAIVFDLLHVVAKYGREVIDRVRVDRANELRADKPARRVIKGARWLLLKNRDSLAPEQDIQLKELLAANRALFVVHVLRDALKDLWSYRRTGYAERAWRSWYTKARRSRIEPLKRFAANLEPYLPGILAHCRLPLGTNLIEGIQGHQAHGLRLPRRRLLLPQDPGGVPRSWVKNLKKDEPAALKARRPLRSLISNAVPASPCG